MKTRLLGISLHYSFGSSLQCWILLWLGLVSVASRPRTLPNSLDIGCIQISFHSILTNYHVQSIVQMQILIIDSHIPWANS